MTAEGTFPKVAGDVIYASEVNRMSAASRGLFIGSTIKTTSGTGAQELGSILISPGSLTNPTYLEVNFKYFKGAGGEAPGIGISGLSENEVDFIYTGSGLINAGGIEAFMTGNCKIMAGSPFDGYINNLVYPNLTSDKSLSVSAQRSHSLNNLHTGSPVVIFFNVSGASTADGQFQGIHVQAFRGTM